MQGHTKPAATPLVRALLDAPGIGAAVRAQRRAAGWTQADLAQRAGCRRQTIVAIEAGQNMEIQTLLAVLAAQGQGLLIVAAQGDLEPPDKLTIQ